MTSNLKIKHVAALVDNVNEVDRLPQIHTQITKAGPGYKPNVQVLHKSAIVLLVACWEAFVEDLSSASLEHILSVAKDYTVFPEYVLNRIASSYSGIKAWKLAGTGWKKVLRGNLKGVLAQTTGSLNTPRTKQVDELFKKAIGLSSLSSSWYWAGRSMRQSSDKLDKLVTLRGSIAHRVASSTNVTLHHVMDARSFIYRLSVKSHNRVCKYLMNQTGKAPWEEVYFEKTK